MPAPAMSDITTHGFRVGATAFYLAQESDPDASQFVYGYRVVILNDSDRPAKLVSRHWEIIDAQGKVKEVDGEGVVGEQPHLEPGRAFKYTSGTVLATAWGTMQGHYEMEAENGETFRIQVQRFFLTPTRGKDEEQGEDD